MIDNSTVEKYDGMVSVISKSYAKKYPTVEREDIKQELWMWFLGHPKKVKQWEEENGTNESIKLIARSLRNAAHDYCVKEKAKQSGYETQDIFWYRKEFIREIIPAALSGNYQRIQKDFSNNSTSGKSPSEGGDWMVYYADIRKAFQSLSEEDQQLVYNFYSVDMDGQALHDMLGSDKPTARATMMAATRALNKMIRKLGGFKPFYDPEIETPEVEETDEELVHEL